MPTAHYTPTSPLAFQHVPPLPLSCQELNKAVIRVTEAERLQELHYATEIQAKADLVSVTGGVSHSDSAQPLTQSTPSTPATPAPLPSLDLPRRPCPADKVSEAEKPFEDAEEDVETGEEVEAEVGADTLVSPPLDTNLIKAPPPAHGNLILAPIPMMSGIT